MKNIMIVIVLEIIMVTGLFAQQDWEWVTPYPSAARPSHSCQADGKVFYNLSGHGCLSTPDGGNSFTEYTVISEIDNSVPMATGDRIAFADSLTGFIVDKGVYKTRDGGKSWTMIFDENKGIDMVTFGDENSGWLIGAEGVLYRTTNLGQVWTRWDLTGLADIPGLIYSVYALDNNKVWACKQFNYQSGGSIAYSSDGGIHFNVQNCPSSDSLSHVYYYDVHVNQSGIGFAVAWNYIISESPHYEPLIVKTIDFGTNWNPVPVEAQIYPKIVISKSDDEWLILGSKHPSGYTTVPVYLRTSDGGATWEYKENILSGSLHSGNNPQTAEYLSKGNILLVSASDGIYRSYNFGSTLTRLSGKNEVQVQGFAIDRSTESSSQLAVVVSERDSFIVSSDGGRNWKKKYCWDGREFSGQVAIAGGIIFAVKNLTDLYKSSNLGETWERIYDGYGSIMGLDAFSDQEITIISFVNSSYPSVIYTKDGGRTWQAAPYLYALQNYIDTPYKDKIYACGSYNDSLATKGYIFNSDDNGHNWNAFDTIEEMRRIRSVNKNTALAVSEHKLYRTTDNGKSWTVVLYTNLNFSNFCFSDTLKGMINISNNLFESTDAGGTWAKSGLSLPYINSWTFLDFNSYGDLIGASDFGVCIHKNPDYDPKNNNHNSVPGGSSGYSLLQNYPNPFNPTTLISYEIRKEGLVQLKVYDILGKEVETLVNGPQKAGSHSVEFNGHNLSSGIYFYQLKAGGFTATRKLVLVK